jgi:hypothetical protein
VLSPPEVTTADALMVPPLTGTVAPGQQDVHPVHVDRADVLAIGADEATGQAVQLSVRAPDGSTTEIGAVDVEPGPAVLADLTDLPPGDYELVVHGQGDGSADYEVWVATGPELSTTPGADRYDGELSDALAGPFLLPGTGTSVEVTAHSPAFDTVLTVLPLGESDASSKLSNDDYSEDCQEPTDSSAVPGSSTPQPPDTGLSSYDSRLSVPTRPGQMYRVYVWPYSSGEGGPYSITTVAAATGGTLSPGQPRSEELTAQGATVFDLPDAAGEVSVQTPGSAVELTVNPGDRRQLTECISPHDLAGARLALTPGPDRTLLIRNLASAPIVVVVTAT